MADAYDYSLVPIWPPLRPGQWLHHGYIMPGPEDVKAFNAKMAELCDKSPAEPVRIPAKTGRRKAKRRAARGY